MRIGKLMVPAAVVLVAGGMMTGCGDAGEKKALVQYLEKQGEVQKAVAEADKKASEQLRQMQDEIAALRKEFEDLKKQAVIPRNTDTLKSIDGAIQISSTTDPRIRVGICAILGQFGGEQAEQRLVQMADKDADASVRIAALTSLNTMASQAVLKIVSAKLESASFEERVAAAQIMVNRPNEAFRVPALAALAKDPIPDNWTNQNARQALYKLMAAIGKPEDLPILRAAWEKDTRDAKRAAMSAIVCIAAGNYELLLEALTGNTDPNAIDETGLAKLEKSADFRLTAALLPVCACDNWRTRQTVYTLLGKIKDPLAAPRLAERFKTESDGDCKRALVAVLAAGYPGLVYTAPDKCTLVPEAEMKTLLADREQKLQQLSAKKTK